MLDHVGASSRVHSKVSAFGQRAHLGDLPIAVIRAKLVPAKAGSGNPVVGAVGPLAMAGSVVPLAITRTRYQTEIACSLRAQSKYPSATHSTPNNARLPQEILLFIGAGLP